MRPLASAGRAGRVIDRDRPPSGGARSLRRRGARSGRRGTAGSGRGSRRIRAPDGPGAGRDPEIAPPPRLAPRRSQAHEPARVVARLTCDEASVGSCRRSGQSAQTLQRASARAWSSERVGVGSLGVKADHHGMVNRSLPRPRKGSCRMARGLLPGALPMAGVSSLRLALPQCGRGRFPPGPSRRISATGATSAGRALAYRPAGPICPRDAGWPPPANDC